MTTKTSLFVTLIAVTCGWLSSVDASSLVDPNSQPVLDLPQEFVAAISQYKYQSRKIPSEKARCEAFLKDTCSLLALEGKCSGVDDEEKVVDFVDQLTASLRARRGPSQNYLVQYFEDCVQQVAPDAEGSPRASDPVEDSAAAEPSVEPVQHGEEPAPVVEEAPASVADESVPEAVEEVIESPMVAEETTAAPEVVPEQALDEDISAVPETAAAKFDPIARRVEKILEGWSPAVQEGAHSSAAGESQLTDEVDPAAAVADDLGAAVPDDAVAGEPEAQVKDALEQPVADEAASETSTGEPAGQKSAEEPMHTAAVESEPEQDAVQVTAGENGAAAVEAEPEVDTRAMEEMNAAAPADDAVDASVTVPAVEDSGSAAGDPEASVEAVPAVDEVPAGVEAGAQSEVAPEPAAEAHEPAPETATVAKPAHIEEQATGDESAAANEAVEEAPVTGEKAAEAESPSEVNEAAEHEPVAGELKSVSEENGRAEGEQEASPELSRLLHESQTHNAAMAPIAVA